MLAFVDTELSKPQLELNYPLTSKSREFFTHSLYRIPRTNRPIYRVPILTVKPSPFASYRALHLPTN